MNRYRAPFLGKTKELHEFCVSITDCHHSTPLYLESGKLVIRNYNIKDGRMLLDNLSFTDDKHFEQRISRDKPLPGDLIITREAPMGEVCIIPEGLECCLGQRMVLIKPDLEIINNQFLLYALMSEYVQEQINKSNGTGSIVSNLRIPVLKELKIPQFKLCTQRKIGRILGNIDAKIKLNNKINTELEAMAKLIYNYWFIQFDFPDENGNPYKSSVGKMVYNEDLKRNVPDGWEVRDLKTLLDYNSGHSFSSKSYCDSGKWKIVTIKSVQESGFDTSKCDRLISIPQNLDDECNLEIGDLLMSLTGNTGRLCFVTESNCLLNQRVAKIWSSELSNYFIYLYFKRPEKQKLIEQLSSGSSQDNLSPLQLFKTKDVVPDKTILKSFEGKIEPMFQRILVNEKENQKLSELRDWLLPMLMNGQVKVK